MEGAWGEGWSECWPPGCIQSVKRITELLDGCDFSLLHLQEKISKNLSFTTLLLQRNVPVTLFLLYNDHENTFLAWLLGELVMGCTQYWTSALLRWEENHRNEALFNVGGNTHRTRRLQAMFFHISKNAWSAYIQLAALSAPRQGWGYISPDDSCTALWEGAGLDLEGMRRVQRGSRWRQMEAELKWKWTKKPPQQGHSGFKPTWCWRKSACFPEMCC